MSEPAATVVLPVVNIVVQLKYLSLILLVVQNVALVLSVKASRIHSSSQTMYLSSTAVVMAEVVKFWVALVLEYVQNTGPGESFWAKMQDEFFNMDTLKLSVPGILYCVQNNLLFVALSNLSVAVYQVSAQMKILTTAVFSVIMLSKRISVVQTVALFVLTAGVGLVQVATANPDQKSSEDGNQIIGMSAILLACCTSGFAGVFFEKILKTGRKVSLYIRNVQLGFFGFTIGLAAVYLNDFTAVMEGGFFQGYDSMVWTAIMVQACGGLLVAVVMKYADNILKGFATSLSIVLATVLSTLVFGAAVNALFVFGASLVLIAVYLYGKYPPKAKLSGEYVPVSTQGDAEAPSKR